MFQGPTSVGPCVVAGVDGMPFGVASVALEEFVALVELVVTGRVRLSPFA